MADIKITDLAFISSPSSTDVLAIVDVDADSGAGITNKISITELLRNASSGTVAAPGIAFNNDQDTGISNPNPNELVFSTDGTGRLFISNDGKIGIGVSDPSSYNISADDLVIADPNGFNSGIQINITDNIGFSNIWFGDSDGEGRGRITYSHGSTDSMDFWVGGNENLSLYETGALAHIGGGSDITPAVSFNGSAPAHSLVIASDGKIGMGASSPSDYDIRADNLVIKGTSHEGITIESGTSNTGNIFFSDADAEGRGQIIYSHLVDRLDFYTAGSHVATIDGSGTFRVKGAGTAGINDAVQLNGSAPANSLLLDADGRVLVGTTSASDRGDAKHIVQGDVSFGDGLGKAHAIYKETANLANAGTFDVDLISDTGTACGFGTVFYRQGLNQQVQTFSFAGRQTGAVVQLQNANVRNSGVSGVTVTFAAVSSFGKIRITNGSGSTLDNVEVTLFLHSTFM